MRRDDVGLLVAEVVEKRLQGVAQEPQLVVRELDRDHGAKPSHMPPKVP